jgi:putative oxidoreductase
MWIFDTSVDKKMNSFALLIVRVVVGVFMLTHGIQKFTMLFADGPVHFADPIGLGETTTLVLVLFAELVCPALLLLGLATRFVCLPLIINMFVIVFIVHSPDGFQKQELPALYLTIYLLLLVTGSGKYSIDHLISHKKRRHSY